MLTAPPQLLRFSTEMLPERDRMAAFREEFARQYLKIDAADRSGGNPRLDLTVLRLGPVAAGCILATATEMNRDALRVKDGVGDCQLHWVVAGSLWSQHAGQDHAYGAGSGLMIDFGRPAKSVGMGRTAVRNLTVPAAALKALVPHPADRAGHMVRPGPALRLLDGYVASLLALDRPPPAELGQLIGLHLLDLVAAAIGPTAEAAEVIAGRGLKAARLRAVLADIARRCGDPSLDVDSVASRLGLSRRSIHRLLAETGRSFTELLTERRLDCAYAMLSESRFSRLRIVDIAFAAGFGDVSHFNHLFRRRFGETPSSARAAGR